MKIGYKLSLLLLFTTFSAIAPLSYIFLKKSETIITEKTFELCLNSASNLSTVAREELLLNNTFDGINGLIQKLRNSQDKSLVSVYVINKYGIYVADLESKRLNQSIDEADIAYLNNVNEPKISKKSEGKQNEIIRFEFPVHLEEKNKDSLKLGFVIFEYDKNLLYETVDQLKWYIIYLSLGLFIFVIIFSIIISKIFTKDIRILSDSANIIGNGNLDLTINIKSKDEIGELAKNFNEMTYKLKQADKFKQALLDSYSKFVPIEFLDYLQKESILEIKLGDQVELEMSVLFSDIRSFTSISEKMSAEDTFKFINSYLEAMVPNIIKHNGFVDKYIGDAIMALFRNPEDALDAGIGMLDELYLYNKIREKYSKFKISIGIGIHTGKLILGIVGSKLRVQGTVISDAVNLASRLEGLTKTYGATLLVSEETLSKVKDPSKYKYRTIDKVKVKGKEEAVNVVEILNGNSERIINLKLSTSKLIQEGIAHFKNTNFTEAISIFEQILQIDPLDKAAKIHLERSKYYKEHGVPLDWEGVEALDHK